MTTPAPAARLRAAAGVVRELSTAATPGPWTPESPLLSDIVTSALLGRVADCSVGTEYRPQSIPDAAWIALMHPGVGEPLAKWLEYVAELAVSVAAHRPDAATEDAPWLAPALALADAILAAVTP